MGSLRFEVVGEEFVIKRRSPLVPVKRGQVGGDDRIKCRA